MINIYTVLMCAFLSLAFYALEYYHSVQANEWGVYAVKESNSQAVTASKYHSLSAVRCLWLARLFLICTIALAIIEQCTFVPDTY